MQEREKLINEAVETRDKIRHEIMAEMEDRAIQHSKDLIAEFLSSEMQKLLHEALVKELIQGLDEARIDQFQIQAEGAELRTAQALGSQEKNRIQNILKEKIKKEVKLKEEVDPTLLGGLILRLGTFVIDGSFTNRLKEAASRLTKETARRYQSTA